MTIWGIHNDRLGRELFDEGFVSVGWDLPDLREIGENRDAIKQRLASIYPDAKSAAIPVWAGILFRFAFEMQPGDFVIAPYKADGTLNFGVITGPYEFHREVAEHPHRRPVRWLHTGVSRALFPKTALYELGSALTLFRVRHHESVFTDYLHDRPTRSPTPAPIQEDQAPDAVDEWAADEPNAAKLEQFTRDVILRTLLTEFSHEEFEYFVADLLRAMGYQARVTPYVADGGVDVIAHRDPLGLEPPMIKVQCKHSAAQRSRPDVQHLIGTLSSGELGLYVTLGAYSSDAISLERERHQLRLLSGKDVVDLVLTHYSALPPQWRARVPLRQVYVVDREGEGR